MYDPPDNSNFADVGRFHARFGLASVTHEGVYPRHPDYEVIEFRIKFLLEEIFEFIKAAGYKLDFVDGQPRLERNPRAIPDHEGMFDALIDEVYVALGTAHLLGYPWQDGWNEVQAANMAKVRAKPDGSDSARGSSFDVVKPPGWTPPNIQALLEARGWNFIPVHEFEVFDGATGRACTAMVMRGGHGDDCGLPPNDPHHHRRYGHNRDGSECTSELCGGVDYDPCIYSPEEIAHIEKIEADGEN